jgi:hypothetical protein
MKLTKSFLSLCTLLAAAAFAGCGNSAQNQGGATTATANTTTVKSSPASISPSVTFGQPQMGGGGCVGKGICKTYASASTAAADAVATTMSISADKKTLTLTFSLSDLTAKQKDQVPYFTDPSGQYNFDAPYPLTDPIYAPLGLLPNPRIDAQSTSAVTIANNVVTDVIVYSHS